MVTLDTVADATGVAKVAVPWAIHAVGKGVRSRMSAAIAVPEPILTMAPLGVLISLSRRRKTS